MRNWRPENERAGVDAIIRKARAVGIGCAQWTAGSELPPRPTCEKVPCEKSSVATVLMPAFGFQDHRRMARQ
jgi:hypothetical protein